MVQELEPSEDVVIAKLESENRELREEIKRLRKELNEIQKRQEREWELKLAYYARQRCGG